jgi:hypothetical protein
MGVFNKYYNLGFTNIMVGKYKLTLKMLNHLAYMYNKSICIRANQESIYYCQIVDIYKKDNKYVKEEIIVNCKQYIANYLIISKIFHSNNFAKKLNLYVDHLNIQYMHPDSAYIKYIADQMETNGDVIPETKGIYYLKPGNKLTILQLE